MRRHAHTLSTTCNAQSVLDALNQRAAVFSGARCERPRSIRLSGCMCLGFDFRPLILPGMPEGLRVITSATHGNGLLVAVLIVRGVTPRLEPHLVELSVGDRFALGRLVNDQMIGQMMELAA